MLRLGDSTFMGPTRSFGGAGVLLLQQTAAVAAAAGTLGYASKHRCCGEV